jgi:hypothetical protein
VHACYSAGLGENISIIVNGSVQREYSPYKDKGKAPSGDLTFDYFQNVTN